MTDETLMEVMTGLFTAANRRLGQTELALWREALSDVRDDLALEAAKVIIREQDLWDHPPTPAMFRSVTRGIAARLDDSRALTEGSGRVTPRDEAKDRLAELRAVLAEKPIVKRIP